MYEPDENRVIEYFGNSERFSSKNYNRYKLDYVHIAALLNRLRLVKFFLNKSNYKSVMEIAVHEDNLELYEMAYKLNSSEDRYMFTKEQLIESKAYRICEELYGQEFVQSFESKQRNCELSDSIERIETVEEFVSFYHDNNTNDTDKTDKQKRVLQLIIQKCEKQVIRDDLYKTESFTPIEKMLYDSEIERINRQSDIKYNKFLLNISKDEKEYTNMITVHMSNPLDDLKNRYLAIKMSQGILSNDYQFNVTILNKVLFLLDDVELIKFNEYKSLLYRRVKTGNYELGPNMTEYINKNRSMISTIKHYDELLCNDPTHSDAYDNNTLDPAYVRKENAIGYTPDDIIIYKTFNEWCDKKTPNKNRSISVKLIDRTKPIIPFDGKVDMKSALQIIPEVFEFSHICGENNNNVPHVTDEEQVQTKTHVDEKTTYSDNEHYDHCDDDNSDDDDDDDKV